MTPLDALLTRIAQQHLGIDTLETRHADDLDFHDTAAWRLKAALEAAYQAGIEAGRRTKSAAADT